MASTKRPIEAFDYVKEMIKDMPLETIQPQILDDVSKIMWMYAPWRWTIGTLTPIPVVAGQIDYTVLDPPADFLYLQKAYLSNGKGGKRDLLIEAVLPAAPSMKGQTTSVAYVPAVVSPAAAAKLRLFPPMTSLDAGETWNIVAWYKKTSPIIKRSNANTPGVQIFDDEYFWVYEDGILARSYYYADDPRAGSATVTNDGKIQFSGQLGIFQASLVMMKEMEPVLTNFLRTAPESKI